MEENQVVTYDFVNIENSLNKFNDNIEKTNNDIRDIFNIINEQNLQDEQYKNSEEYQTVIKEEKEYNEELLNTMKSIEKNLSSLNESYNNNLEKYELITDNSKELIDVNVGINRLNSISFFVVCSVGVILIYKLLSSIINKFI